MSQAISHEAFQRLRSIIATSELPSLGPEPRANVKPASPLRGEIEEWKKPLRLDERTGELILSAALLWHDHLDESHALSQGIGTAEGSFLHGIMHRREPDYGNAKYWFHRVSRHATFPEIGVRVERLLSNQPGGLAARLVSNGVWQPMSFIDACEEAADHAVMPQDVKVLQTVQQVEFDALLEYICAAS